MPLNAARLCSGACGASAAICRLTSSLMVTGDVYRVPPCTTRWPTTPISSGPLSGASGPSHRRRSNRLAVTPWAGPGRQVSVSCQIGAGGAGSDRPEASSYRAALSVLEPALRARAITVGPAGSTSPGPGLDLRQVLAVAVDVLPVLDQLVAHRPADVGGAHSELRHLIDDITHESEPVDLVADGHVEGRRRRALFLVAAHVEVAVVRATVGQAVDEPRVAVEVEDHRPVGGEQRVELAVGESVGMLALRLERHQVDDIDHPHLEIREVPAQEVDRGERLKRGHVPGTGHHDVGLAAVVIAGPIP